MIARDSFGRDISAMARLYKSGLLSQSFMGGDPNTIAFLVSSGMSQTDANFIADYAPVDKAQLVALIQGGLNPYNALTQIYGGNYYLPNVDNPPLASYKHPTYVPPIDTYRAMLAQGKPASEILAAAGAATSATTAPTSTVSTVTTVEPQTLPFGIPDKIAGIPTLYLAGGAALAILLLNN